MSPGERLLAELSPDLQRIIKRDIAKFSPFLALLDDWATTMEARIALAENEVTARLSEQFYPSGSWHWPAQAVIAPIAVSPRNRHWNNGVHAVSLSGALTFTDSDGAIWTPAGKGWMLPTTHAAEEWFELPLTGGRTALIWHLEHDQQDGDLPLIESERGLLAYARLDDAGIETMRTATWGIQLPGETQFQPVSVERYGGYMEFERDMGIASTCQRHLERFLPAFHPYGRKFVHFRAAGAEAEEMDWRPLGQHSRVARLAGVFSNAALRERRLPITSESLVFNAIPVVQVRVKAEDMGRYIRDENFGKDYILLENFLAASARTGDQIHPVTYTSSPVQGVSLEAQEANRIKSVKVHCGKAEEARVYDKCKGTRTYRALQPELRKPDAPTGQALERPSEPWREWISSEGEEFELIASPVGGKSIEQDAREKLRCYWYHNMLRPESLTEGDLHEIVRSLPVFDDLLEPGCINLELDSMHERWPERSQWQDYLWPTLVSDELSLERKTPNLAQQRTEMPGATPANQESKMRRIAITPVMRVRLRKQSHYAPPELLEEVAQYVASVLMQHFQTGWYRVAVTIEDARQNG